MDDLGLNKSVMVLKQEVFAKSRKDGDNNDVCLMCGEFGKNNLALVSLCDVLRVDAFWMFVKQG